MKKINSVRERVSNLFETFELGLPHQLKSFITAQINWLYAKETYLQCWIFDPNSHSDLHNQLNLFITPMYTYWMLEQAASKTEFSNKICVWICPAIYNVYVHSLGSRASSFECWIFVRNFLFDLYRQLKSFITPMYTYWVPEQETFNTEFSNEICIWICTTN